MTKIATKRKKFLEELRENEYLINKRGSRINYDLPSVITITASSLLSHGVELRTTLSVPKDLTLKQFKEVMERHPL